LQEKIIKYLSKTIAEMLRSDETTTEKNQCRRNQLL